MAETECDVGHGGRRVDIKMFQWLSKAFCGCLKKEKKAKCREERRNEVNDQTITQDGKGDQLGSSLEQKNDSSKDIGASKVSSNLFQFKNKFNTIFSFKKEKTNLEKPINFRLPSPMRYREIWTLKMRKYFDQRQSCRRLKKVGNRRRKGKSSTARNNSAPRSRNADLRKKYKSARNNSAPRSRNADLRKKYKSARNNSATRSRNADLRKKYKSAREKQRRARSLNARLDRPMINQPSPARMVCTQTPVVSTLSLRHSTSMIGSFSWRYRISDSSRVTSSSGDSSQVTNVSGGLSRVTRVSGGSPRLTSLSVLVLKSSSRL
ncbi:hypothetical protein Btru_076325 [Bulinus truncatus]|nr:hypothetical protein Btru_076325 [Bulinus truncatus]